MTYVTRLQEVGNYMGITIRFGVLHVGSYKDCLSTKLMLHKKIKDKETGKIQDTPQDNLGKEEYYSVEEHKVAIFMWKRNCKNAIKDIKLVQD